MTPKSLAIIAASAAGIASAQYTGPFTLLSSNGLDGTADPTLNFGPADHLVRCQGGLSFIDIDAATGNLLSSSDAGLSWNTVPLTFTPCPDGLPLAPRDSGYVVGVTPNPTTGLDRMMLLGGDDTDSDIWVSDDCGLTFTCIDTPEIWDPRGWPFLISAPFLPGTPIFMGGGVTDGLISVGLFQSLDGGSNWTRPPCDPSQCINPYDDDMSYLMPDAPATQGMLATDGSSNLYFFDDFEQNDDPDLALWYLNASNYNMGWLPIPGSDTTNVFGRKVWIGSTTPGNPNGCWFSTDFDTDDLYVIARMPVNSMNSFSTAKTASGPWTVAPIQAPWAPRASAVLVSLQSTAVFAGGLSFQDGNPTTPTYGDVWAIDAGVCLLNPTSGLVCSGHGTPDLDAVACVCDPAWQGDALCSTCTPGTTYGPNCDLCPKSQDGAACNSAAGGGSCNAQSGCVCNTGWSGSACDTCAVNYAGPSCAPCAPCSTHGSCSGSGSTSGTGQCVCNVGWAGNTCQSCAFNYWGPLCAACATCSPLGGSCNGNGTSSGTGQCVCNAGWSGTSCNIPPPSSNNAPADGNLLSPGGAAGVSIVVLGLVGVGAFVTFSGGVAPATAIAKTLTSKVLSSLSSHTGSYQSITKSGFSSSGSSSTSTYGSTGSSSGGGSSSPTSALKGTSRLSSDAAASRLIGASTSGGGYGAA